MYVWNSCEALFIDNRWTHQNHEKLTMQKRSGVKLEKKILKNFQKLFKNPKEGKNINFKAIKPY